MLKPGFDLGLYRKIKNGNIILNRYVQEIMYSVLRPCGLQQSSNVGNGAF